MIVKINEQELVQRIFLKLAKNTEGLKKPRNGQSNNITGEYYTIGFNQNKITTPNVDLKKLGKDLGVFKNLKELEG
jgi:hypothetical protein